MTTTRILVCDDSESSLDGLARHLGKKLHDQAKIFKAQKISANLNKNGPYSDIVFDIGMGDQELKKLISAKSQAKTSVRLWLVSGKTKGEIETFKCTLLSWPDTLSVEIQPQVYLKPFRPKILSDDIRAKLATVQPHNKQDTKKKLGTDQVHSIVLEAEIETFLRTKRPTRIVTVQGLEVCTNDLWKQELPENIRIRAYSEDEINTLNRDKYLERHHWIPSTPPDRFGHYYTERNYICGDWQHIAQTLIEERPDANHLVKGNDYLPELQPAQLQELAAPLIRALTDSLFTRGRLYLVRSFPGGGRSKQALFCIGKTARNFEGTKKACVGLDMRLGDYVRQARNLEQQRVREANAELIYQIVDANDADPDWDEVVGMEGVPNWLEVPILRGKDEDTHVVALLVFDRQPDGRIGDNSAQISEDDIDTDDNHFHTLRGAVVEVRAVLGRDFAWQRYRHTERINEWRRGINLPEKQGWNPKSLLESALDTAVGYVEELTPKSAQTASNASAQLSAVCYLADTSHLDSDGNTSTRNFNWTYGSGIFEKPCDQQPLTQTHEFFEPWTIQDLASRNATQLEEEITFIQFSSTAYTQLGGQGSLLIAPIRQGGNTIAIWCFHCSVPNHFNWQQWHFINDFSQELGPALSQQRSLSIALNVQRIYVHQGAALVGTSLRNLEDDHAAKPSLQRLQYYMQNMRRARRLFEPADTVVNAAKVHTLIEESFRLNKDYQQAYSLQRVDGLNNFSTQNLVADETALELAIYNLTENALKYCHPGEAVGFSTDTRQTGWLRICWTNPITTPLDNNVLSRLCEPSYSVPQNNRRDGLGLGLYVTKQLVEAQGGKLLIKQQSCPKSRDIQFTVELHWPTVTAEKPH